MIAKLKGILDTIGFDYLILDVQGVGYHVTVSTRTLTQLPSPGEALILWTEMLVRQEMPSLIGFLSLEEKEAFGKLIVVQGVGAKVALAILSVLTPTELALAIHRQDKDQIVRADGVGPKLATRLLTELKDKILISDAALTQSLPGMGRGKSGSAPFSSSSTSIQDVFSALDHLGYRRSEAASAVAKAVDQHGAEADVSVLIRTALGLLSLKLTGTEG